jgi:hypothetical protein
VSTEYCCLLELYFAPNKTSQKTYLQESQTPYAKKHTCRSLKCHKTPPARIFASKSVDTTRHGDLDFNPPRPVTFLRDRLWRFAALVIGTPSHSIFFEEHIFKPGKVTTISYSVKRIYHPWGFSTGDDLYCRCPARPGRWTSLCSSAVASSTTFPIALYFKNSIAPALSLVPMLTFPDICARAFL